MGEVHAIAGKDKGDNTVFQAREEKRTLWVWLFLLPFLLSIGFNWWRNGSTCSFGGGMEGWGHLQHPREPGREWGKAEVAEGKFGFCVLLPTCCLCVHVCE